MREFIVFCVSAIPVAAVIAYIVTHAIPDNFPMQLVAAAGLNIIYTMWVGIVYTTLGSRSS